MFRDSAGRKIDGLFRMRNPETRIPDLYPRVQVIRWDDFDPDRKTLTVRRSVSQVNSGIVVKETTTGRARVVMLPNTLVSELVSHQMDRQHRKKILGDDYRDNGWICAGPCGERLSPKWLSNQFSRLAKSVGVSITLHGLRHTQATMLIMSGIPVKAVSERLGHSTVTITQDTYAHVTPHIQQQAAEIVEGILSGDNRKSKLPSS